MYRLVEHETLGLDLGEEGVVREPDLFKVLAHADVCDHLQVLGLEHVSLQDHAVDEWLRLTGRLDSLTCK